MKKEEVLEVRIELTINSQTALFIVLGKDGSLARQGSGNREISKERYVGQSDGQYFMQLMKNLDEEIFKHFGIYDMPEKDGDACTLSLVFKDDQRIEGFEFYYGYKSKNGPHVEVLSLVEKAVKLTEDWYRGANRKPGKRWWQIFKN
jgi:hypothetical protein